MKLFTRICLGIGLVSIGLGIGCLILAAGSRRHSFRDVPTYSREESFTGIHSLDIRIDYGDVSVVEGDGFRINAKRLYEEVEFDAYVSDGVWIIKQDMEGVFDLFGFTIPFRFETGDVDYTPDIEITVPRGFSAENIYLELNAGRTEAEVIRSGKGTFKVDAGELRINELKIPEESSYTVDAGHISLNNVEVGNITVDCGIGYVEIAGFVTGDNRITCDVGKVNMELDGNPKQYSYDIDSDIGNVIIDGKSYHRRKINSDSVDKTEGSFLLECDIGNITLDFNE